MTFAEVKFKVAEVLPDLKKLGVEELLVFGSVVRDQAKDDSDVDFLVQLKSDSSIDDYFRVLFLLEDILGLPVDLIERAALRNEIAGRVLAEAIRVA